MCVPSEEGLNVHTGGGVHSREEGGVVEVIDRDTCMCVCVYTPVHVIQSFNHSFIYVHIFSTPV